MPLRIASRELRTPWPQQKMPKKEMQNVTADSERLLQEARVEREAMIKEAREIKEKMVSDAKNWLRLKRIR